MRLSQKYFQHRDTEQQSNRETQSIDIYFLRVTHPDNYRDSDSVLKFLPFKTASFYFFNFSFASSGTETIFFFS